MSEITLRFIGIGDDGGKYEFGFLDILEVDSTFGIAIYEGKMVHIDPATIQPADDPRKALLENVRDRFLWLFGNNKTHSIISRTQVNAILDEMEAKL